MFSGIYIRVSSIQPPPQAFVFRMVSKRCERETRVTGYEVQGTIRKGKEGRFIACSRLRDGRVRCIEKAQTRNKTAKSYNFHFHKNDATWPLSSNGPIYSWSASILFLNEDVPVKNAKITAEGDFSQPSSKHHSFAEVFLVSLIINLRLTQFWQFVSICYFPILRKVAAHKLKLGKWKVYW